MILGNMASTQARVFQGRVHPLAQTELPCLLIYTLEEEVPESTMGRPRKLRRMLKLAVEGKARASADVEDRLDTIAAEVEAAIADDPTLNALAKDVLLTATSVVLTEQGDSPHGSITLEFQIEYHTLETAPTTALA